MDSESDIIRGRPYGGCAILWKDSANIQFNTVAINNTRVCAVIAKLASNIDILLVNAYLPCDEGYRGPNHAALVETLEDIHTLIMDSRVTSVILGGDLNCDFTRSTPHVKTVSDFISHNNMKQGISHILSTVDFTYESKSAHSRSCIDHFLFTSDLFHAVNMMSTCDNEDNFSDHHALTCELDINITYAPCQEQSNMPKPNWRKATHYDIEKYREHLNRLLCEVVSTIICDLGNNNCSALTAHGYTTMSVKLATQVSHLMLLCNC